MLLEPLTLIHILEDVLASCSSWQHTYILNFICNLNIEPQLSLFLISLFTVAALLKTQQWKHKLHQVLSVSNCDISFIIIL